MRLLRVLVCGTIVLCGAGATALLVTGAGLVVTVLDGAVRGIKDLCGALFLASLRTAGEVD